VLIKGMKMPKGCASCFLKYGSCYSIRRRTDESKGDKWCPENYRHPDCPLIEVPIDYDELLKAAKAMHTWIFLNSGDEQEAYDECGLTNEMSIALGYGGQFIAGQDGET
jgi:hypothetical protein